MSGESLALVKRNRAKITNDMADRFAGTQVILKVPPAQIESIFGNYRQPPPPLFPAPASPYFSYPPFLFQDSSASFHPSCGT